MSTETETRPEVIDVVFVRSNMTGRTALVARRYIKQKYDTDTPTVDGITEPLEEITFNGSDTVVDGVQRRFWLAVISRETFRLFLKETKVALLEGSDSVYRMGGKKSPEVLALIKEATKALPKFAKSTEVI